MIATVIDVDATEDVSERIVLRVEAVVRGVSGPEVVLEPPTFMGCDGRIMEPVGSRLLVATGPRYFSVGPAEEMHPYWRILDGDAIEPAGVDDPDPDHKRLAGLVADLGGLLVTSPEPGEIAEPVRPADRSSIVPVAIVVVTLLAAAVLFSVVVLAARRRPKGDRR